MKLLILILTAAVADCCIITNLYDVTDKEPVEYRGDGFQSGAWVSDQFLTPKTQKTLLVKLKQTCTIKSFSILFLKAVLKVKLSFSLNDKDYKSTDFFDFLPKTNHKISEITPQKDFFNINISSNNLFTFPIESPVTASFLKITLKYPYFSQISIKSLNIEGNGTSTYILKNESNQCLFAMEPKLNSALFFSDCLLLLQGYPDTCLFYGENLLHYQNYCLKPVGTSLKLRDCPLQGSSEEDFHLEFNYKGQLYSPKTNLCLVPSSESLIFTENSLKFHSNQSPPLKNLTETIQSTTPETEVILTFPSLLARKLQIFWDIPPSSLSISVFLRNKKWKTLLSVGTNTKLVSELILPLEHLSVFSLKMTESTVKQANYSFYKINTVKLFGMGTQAVLVDCSTAPFLRQVNVENVKGFSSNLALIQGKYLESVQMVEEQNENNLKQAQIAAKMSNFADFIDKKLKKINLKIQDLILSLKSLRDFYQSIEEKTELYETCDDALTQNKLQKGFFTVRNQFSKKFNEVACFSYEDHFLSFHLEKVPKTDKIELLAAKKCGEVGSLEFKFFETKHIDLFRSYLKFVSVCFNHTIPVKLNKNMVYQEKSYKKGQILFFDNQANIVTEENPLVDSVICFALDKVCKVECKDEKLKNRVCPVFRGSSLCKTGVMALVSKANKGTRRFSEITFTLRDFNSIQTSFLETKFTSVKLETAGNSSKYDSQYLLWQNRMELFFFDLPSKLANSRNNLLNILDTLYLDSKTGLNKYKDSLAVTEKIKEDLFSFKNLYSKESIALYENKKLDVRLIDFTNVLLARNNSYLESFDSLDNYIILKNRDNLGKDEFVIEKANEPSNQGKMIVYRGKNNNKSQETFLILKNKAFEGFSLQGTLKAVNYQKIGIIFHFRDIFNYYCIQVENGLNGGTIKLIFMWNGKAQEYVPRSFGVLDKVFYNFSVEVRGNAVKFKLDRIDTKLHTEVFEYNYLKFSNGMVGFLAAGQGTLSINHFYVGQNKEKQVSNQISSYITNTANYVDNLADIAEWNLFYKGNGVLFPNWRRDTNSITQTSLFGGDFGSIYLQNSQNRLFKGILELKYRVTGEFKSFGIVFNYEDIENYKLIKFEQDQLSFEAVERGNINAVLVKKGFTAREGKITVKFENGVRVESGAFGEEFAFSNENGTFGLNSNYTQVVFYEMKTYPKEEKESIFIKKPRNTVKIKTKCNNIYNENKSICSNTACGLIFCNKCCEKAVSADDSIKRRRCVIDCQISFNNQLKQEEVLKKLKLCQNALKTVECKRIQCNYICSQLNQDSKCYKRCVN